MGMLGDVEIDTFAYIAATHQRREVSSPQRLDQGAGSVSSDSSGPGSAAGLKAALLSLAVPLFIVVGFGATFITAFHHPFPHHIKVAVVGPAQVSAAIAVSVDAHDKGSFTISPVASLHAGRRLLLERKIYGVYQPLPSPTALVAGADNLSGPVEKLFAGLAASQGHRLSVQDVRPLPAADETGVMSFFFIIICTLVGFLTVVVLAQAAPGLPFRLRIPVLVGVAIVAPFLTWLIMGPIDGALTSSATGVASTIGIGMVYTLAIALVGQALQDAVSPIAGALAILPMMLIFILLNFPSSGGPVPAPLLPAFWRFLHHFWVGAGAVNGVQNALYFHDAGSGHDLVIVGVWALLGAAALALIYQRKHARRPAQAPVGIEEPSGPFSGS